MSTVETKQETAIATKPKSNPLMDWLNNPDTQGQLSRVLPRLMTPDRMTRVVLNSMNRTPKLKMCTVSSFAKCFMDLASWGLEPDGRHAHLIPYENKKDGTIECQLIVDYKGLITLAYRGGWVKRIHADVVYEGDTFRYSLGEVRDHEPWAFRVDAAKPEKQGNVFAVYCIVTMNDGIEKHEVMTIDEVRAIKNRSRAGGSGPWVTDFNEMAKKTVFRRASKWLPLSAEQRDAFERDDDKLIDAVSVRVTQSLTKAALPAITHVESEVDQ